MVISNVFLVKQCHNTIPQSSPFIGGIYKPFPVMGGKHGIVLTTLLPSGNQTWQLKTIQLLEFPAICDTGIPLNVPLNVP
jgi:hypothetical protein